MSEETYEISAAKIKEKLNKGFNFVKDKKIILTVVVLVLILGVIIFSSWIRLQNLPLLVDGTTGENIPVALDPFYYLRISETIVEQGGLPEYDPLRKPFDVPYSREILPNAVVLIYQVMKIFDNDVTLQFANVVSPVIFFASGMVVFFFLALLLTKSKTAALISSVFLAFIPSYLYRTTAGFSDHEAIGIFAFFLALAGFGFSLKLISQERKKVKVPAKKPEGTLTKPYVKTTLLGILTGTLTVFTVLSWVGISRFLFMIFPLSFGLFWIIKNRNDEDNKDSPLNYFVFYGAWLVSTILILLVFGFSFGETIERVLMTSTSLLTGAVFLFALADYVIIRNVNKIKKSSKPPEKEEVGKVLNKYRILFSAGIVILTFVLILVLTGKLHVLTGVADSLFNPIVTERVALTVAENRQTYLSDWINSTGQIFFWLFFAGLMSFGISMASELNGKGSDKVKEKKGRKYVFTFLWMFLVSGILFSRYSPDALFNGNNFISMVFYVGSILLFFGYFLVIYFRKGIEISPEKTLIFSWILIMLIATRSSIRLLFVITPLACLMTGILFANVFGFYKKAKDDLLKLMLVMGIILMLVFSAISLTNQINAVSVQARNTGPGAHVQWQNAMKWTRENTNEDDVFVHWWDYGYWVQYLGERPTLADGGHFQGAFRDHLIGRYLLTETKPETALSFMKSNNVSYLLIDQTDLGKYGAYSKIGSGKDGTDRFSYVPIMISDPGQRQVINDTEINYFSGGVFVDEDIIYMGDGEEIFLPSQKAGMSGVILKVRKTGGEEILERPEAVFVHGNNRYRIPLRYVYLNGKLTDFREGLEAGIKIIPRFSSSSDGSLRADNVGSLIYLSPKVFKGLFAQLYLMNDPMKKYETVKIAHVEHDTLVSGLNSQGANLEFVFFDGYGFRGPIKIWKTDYPDEILVKEEFLRREGEYAEFDNLNFVVEEKTEAK